MGLISGWTSEPRADNVTDGLLLILNNISSTCLDLDGHPVRVNVEGCVDHAERASDHLDLREVTLQSTSSPHCPEAGLHEGASVSPKCWGFPLNHAQDGETSQKHNCCPHSVLANLFPISNSSFEKLSHPLFVTILIESKPPALHSIASFLCLRSRT